MQRRLALLLLTALFSPLCQAAAKQAKATPTGKLVVPAPPGGLFDRVARLLEPVLSSRLMPIVIENRPDSQRLAVAKSLLDAPDASPTFIVLGSDAAWGVRRRFKPVALLGSRPVWLLAAAGGAGMDIRQLIEEKRAPRIDASNLVTAFAARQVFGDNARWQSDRQGSAPPLAELLGGAIDLLAIHPFQQILELAEAGKIRVLAVTSDYRDQTFGAPTFRTLGKPREMVEGFVGLFASPNVGAQQIERASIAVANVFEDGEMRARLAQAGLKLPSERSADGLRGALSRAIEALGPVAAIGNVCEVRKQCVELDYCRPPPCPE